MTEKPDSSARRTHPRKSSRLTFSPMSNPNRKIHTCSLLIATAADQPSWVDRNNPPITHGMGAESSDQRVLVNGTYARYLWVVALSAVIDESASTSCVRDLQCAELSAQS